MYNRIRNSLVSSVASIQARLSDKSAAGRKLICISRLIPGSNQCAQTSLSMNYGGVILGLSMLSFFVSWTGQPPILPRFYAGLLDLHPLPSPPLPAPSLRSSNQKVVQSLASPLSPSTGKGIPSNHLFQPLLARSPTPFPNSNPRFQKWSPTTQGAPNRHSNHNSKSLFRILSCNYHLPVVVLLYQS